MSKVLGIINYDDNFEKSNLLDKRSLGAVSIFGRYRLIDFTISNMTNSGIESIQVCVRENPRSIIEHIDSGVQYNVNSKRGKLYILFGDSSTPSIYNTDVKILKDNLHLINEKKHDYVVMAPSYMIHSIDYREVVKQHEQSKADVTVVYRKIDDADLYFKNCQCLTVDKDNRVTKTSTNLGKYKNRNVSLEAYVLSKELFVKFIEEASDISSLYSFKDIIADKIDELKIYGYNFKGMVYCINSLEMYYRASMKLINYKSAKEIMRDDWPIYTQTNDSEPSTYTKDSKVKNSVVCNGCFIEGTVENSVIGRNVKIGKNAVVKNSIIMADTTISEDTEINYAVVDKHVSIRKIKKLSGKVNNPVYIERNDKI